MDSLTMVDPAKIIIDQFIRNSRTGPVDVSDLVESIPAHGIQAPLCVHIERRRAPGEVNKTRFYHLVYGFRRREAALKVGLKIVPCTLFHGTREEAILSNLVENVDRKDPVPSDIARTVIELREAGMDVTAISKRIHLSASYLYALTHAYSTVEPEVMALFDTGKLRLADVQAVKALPAREQRAVAQKVAQISEPVIERGPGPRDAEGNPISWHNAGNGNGRGLEQREQRARRAENKTVKLARDIGITLTRPAQARASVIAEATGRKAATMQTRREIRRVLDEVVPVVAQNEREKAIRQTLEWVIGERKYFPALSS